MGEGCSQGCWPRVGSLSREMEDMFCDKRKCIQKPLLESGGERMDETLTLGGCAKVSSSYQLQSLQPSPDRTCGLNWTVQVDFISSPFNEMEGTFPISKLLLNVNIVFNSIQVLFFK